MPGSASARAFVLLLASAIAGWWLIGDASEPARSPDDLSYSIRAPDIPEPVTVAAGVVGLAVTLAVEHRLVEERATRLPAIVLVGCGAAAWCGRVLTAGVHGANIGAGFVLLFHGPAVAMIAAAAFVRVARLDVRATS